MNTSDQPMNSAPIHRRIALALTLIAAPTLTSCVTETQMRLSVEERDREIAVLRTDKVELQERVTLMTYEAEDLRAQLANAKTVMPSTQPASFTEEAALVPFPELENQGITVSRRAGDTVISVPTEITFGSGKATVSKEGRRALASVASRLKSDFPDDAKFHIEGHTDSDPIKKSKFKSNRDLSIQRAVAVLQFLVSEARISDSRFVVAGYGEYAPVAPNQGSQKGKNRRVEIVVKDRR
ncbi:MAG: OmpA family protein [Planctomycetota bacterium]|nr:OmpA family protein [Planctomycetota bacterium]